MNKSSTKSQLDNDGFAILNSVFSANEIQEIIKAIEKADSSKDTFRRSSDLFAIRQFFKEVPAAVPLIFNSKFKELVGHLFGTDYFVVKSIYFDKPGQSNWFVSYHQDLTISVDKKADNLSDFTMWTSKQGQFAVQPPLHILQNIFTVRIHLDSTDENNGALKVVPKSHLKGIYRPETIDWSKEIEATCKVPQGGLMIMRPLLLHCSSRTTSGQARRVIHIEFSNQELPAELRWAERLVQTA